MHSLIGSLEFIRYRKSTFKCFISCPGGWVTYRPYPSSHSYDCQRKRSIEDDYRLFYVKHADQPKWLAGKLFHGVENGAVGETGSPFGRECFCMSCSSVASTKSMNDTCSMQLRSLGGDLRVKCSKPTYVLGMTMRARKLQKWVSARGKRRVLAGKFCFTQYILRPSSVS